MELHIRLFQYKTLVFVHYLLASLGLVDQSIPLGTWLPDGFHNTHPAPRTSRNPLPPLLAR